MSLVRRIEGAIKRSLARLGIDIRRLPAPLLRSPGSQLDISLALVVEHYLAVHRPEDFFFIQVGSFDGVSNDPIRALVARHRWKGVLVEPQPEAFAALQRTYADHPQVRLVNAAVATEPGTQILYTVDTAQGDFPPWAQQLASFRRDTLLAHRRAIPGLAAAIREQAVECLTLDQILSEAPGQRLDLLQIDAEGYDAAILTSLDLTQHRPVIIRYEHKHLSRREQATCIEHLLAHGYRIAVGEEDTLALNASLSDEDLPP